ncbi:hypothetical protein IMCC3317_29950 [Kordia antarctica]|uniref:Uncharacterized protein n=1 Tax=Kordia antarctica TaxID=1218801 RepID=A0A7L4ZM07_9FLAO|nr:class I lanthipeptide [Kordia antarctica]QHI37615.1 hypothetical protein IMCC3317_29950 [Kordia antarctica]
MKKRSIKRLELNKERICILTDSQQMEIEGGVTPTVTTVTWSSAHCIIIITATISAKFC